MSKRRSLRQKQRLAAKDRKDSRRILFIVIGATVVLLVLLYLTFQASF